MIVLDVEDAVVQYKAGSWLGAKVSGRPYRIDAVAGVSLELPAGKTYGLVGESGSGKTTLGRAIVGLVPLTSGIIRIDGADAQGYGDGPWRLIRRDVALIFQDPVAALNPRMTVEVAITEPLAIHRTERFDRRAEARRLLDMVGLPANFLDRYPHELSGGQARRIAVARALALRPKLIIADEPTAGLDVSVQGDILNLLSDLQDELNISYLIITHNLAVARHVTDYVGIMYLGRLVETGTTADVFKAPSHPYTKALLAAHATEAGQVAPPIRGEIPSLWHRPTGCEFHSRCPVAQPICSAQAPPMVDVSPNHHASCHFAVAYHAAEA
jgi:peptide/nickel transport system ATP-binding protein